MSWRTSMRPSASSITLPAGISFFAMATSSAVLSRIATSESAQVAMSGPHLAADLSGGIGGAVHVDVEIAEPVRLVLGVVEPDRIGHGPQVLARPVQGHDHGPVLPRGGHVNMRGGSGDARRRHAAAY